MEDKLNSLELQLLNYNKIGMELLRENKFSESLYYLKEAEALLSSQSQRLRSIKLIGITLNNLGCYYKKCKHPELALKYISQAINYEKIDANPANLAGTHLNLCVIYSELESHEKALEEGLKAIEILDSESTLNINLINTQIIAFYNIGAELEYLKRFSESLEYFKMAYQVSIEKLGINNDLSLAMKKNLDDVSNRCKNHAINKPKLRTKSSFGQNVKSETPRRNINSSLPPMSQYRDLPNAMSPNLCYLKQKIEIEFPKILGKTENSAWNYEAKSIKDGSSPKTHKYQRFLTGERLQPMFFNPNLKIQHKRNSKTTRPENKNSIHKKKRLIFGQNLTEEKRLTGRSIRKKDKFLKKDAKELAAIKIQRFYRNYLKMRKRKNLYRKRLEISNTEPINILNKLNQNTNKKGTGFNNKNYQELIAERNLNIAYAQAAIRGYEERKALNLMRRASIIIQKNLRKYQCKKLYIEIREAIIFIQRIYRSYIKNKTTIRN
ncbi:unnamed protein product [Blepharisma stoltei]|uniref:Tetratricopeptide repeat protein n=1 Tax=Blepharisma stoltei TaxID=1481888 RepID=A0AAU9JBQ8_9CILI|nr:unnamed protein product [Blepharisma stoltei]